MKNAEKKSTFVRDDESMTVHEGSDEDDMYFASDDDVRDETLLESDQITSSQVYWQLADLEKGIESVFIESRSLEQTKIELTMFILGQLDVSQRHELLLNTSYAQEILK